MTVVAGIQTNLLKQYIERVERLEAEKAEISVNIRDVLSEAKADGFEPKIMKQVIKLRKMKKEEIDEQDMLLTTYQRALGMLPNFEE